MAAQSTTISSLGVSPVIILNPVLKTTTLQVTGNGSSGAGVFVQFTLDDPTTTPAPTISWANLSSAIIVSTGAGVDANTIYTVLSPLGGLRLSSSNAITGSGITLKSLQSVTG